MAQAMSAAQSIAVDLTLLARELAVAGRIFLRGVLDSLNIAIVYKALKKKDIRSLVWNCLFLNLFIFLGSNFFYAYALTPFFNWLTTTESEDMHHVVVWVKWIIDFFWTVREKWRNDFLSFFFLLRVFHWPWAVIRIFSARTTGTRVIISLSRVGKIILFQ